jgi:hypothetical protein
MKGDAMSGENGDNVRELRPGEKAKVKDPNPPAEAPRTWRAPEVRDVAYRLIAAKRPHMSQLKQMHIEYVFSNADHEGELDLAKAIRFNPTYGYLYEDEGAVVPQFILRVAKGQWDNVPTDLREQALYHYLLQFSVDEHSRPAIEKPDVVAFAAEIEQFPGDRRWNKGLQLARQMGLFDKEPAKAAR